MRVILPALFSFSLAVVSPAQTCRKVVRDASGRIVQTIDRQKSSGGTVQATTTRDASGRLTGSSSGSGKCNTVTITPVPPRLVK
jgi:hypothetical protein